ncbi:MAG: prepilin-type N-terminal cleavage/methylation domain-containing protein [Desulfotignum sp.]|nr:prepilin-type N-terminal cleavage/methylation domain-containing protein [Desulfotignum sp.]
MTENNTQNGFTFLEVLIALAIFSIGLLAINAMTAMVIKSNYQSRNLTTAVSLAQNKMDELKAGAYGSIVDKSESGLDSEGTAGSGIFDCDITVTTNAAPDYKTVEVKVSWSDPDPREVAMQTVIAK